MLKADFHILSCVMTRNVTFTVILGLSLFLRTREDEPKGILIGIVEPRDSCGQWI